MQAYRGVIDRGRYPVLALFIELPPGEVDVNVHPTKHEVRFRNQGGVHDAIRGVLENVLAEAPWITPARGNTEPFSPPPAAAPVTERRLEEVREALAAYRPELRQQALYGGTGHLGPVFGTRTQTAGLKDSGLGSRETERETRNEKPETLNSNPETAAEPSGYFSALTVIGQFDAAYIVCQDGDDLLLVDQHAAHERVAFELLKAEFAVGGVEAQGLLFPATVELSFTESAVLRENHSDIGRLGFEIEEFGGNTWLVKAVPRMLAATDYLRLLRDILEDLQGLGRSRTFADAREEFLTRIACHSVVRGARTLSRQEMAALFARMDAADFSGNCPHGRPVCRKITRNEIERMFKRQ
jgi:DNA mismatch repair protein MutL